MPGRLACDVGEFTSEFWAVSWDQQLLRGCSSQMFFCTVLPAFSIHPFSTPRGVAGAYASWLRVKGGLHHEQVASQSQGAYREDPRNQSHGAHTQVTIQVRVPPQHQRTYRTCQNVNSNKKLAAMCSHHRASEYLSSAQITPTFITKNLYCVEELICFVFKIQTGCSHHWLTRQQIRKGRITTTWLATSDGMGEGGLEWVLASWETNPESWEETLLSRWAPAEGIWRRLLTGCLTSENNLLWKFWFFVFLSSFLTPTVSSHCSTHDSHLPPIIPSLWESRSLLISELKIDVDI